MLMVQGLVMGLNGVSVSAYHLFLHNVYSVRGRDHSVTYMLTSRYKFTQHNIVLMLWVSFVAGAHAMSDKLLQTWDLDFTIVVLH